MSTTTKPHEATAPSPGRSVAPPSVHTASLHISAGSPRSPGLRATSSSIRRAATAAVHPPLHQQSTPQSAGTLRQRDPDFGLPPSWSALEVLQAPTDSPATLGSACTDSVPQASSTQLPAAKPVTAAAMLPSSPIVAAKPALDIGLSLVQTEHITPEILHLHTKSCRLSSSMPKFALGLHTIARLIPLPTRPGTTSFVPLSKAPLVFGHVRVRVCVDPLRELRHALSEVRHVLERLVCSLSAALTATCFFSATSSARPSAACTFTSWRWTGSFA